MSIPPLQAVEPLDAVSRQGGVGSLPAGPEIAQLLQSAASAAGCPIAILYLEEAHGFRPVEAHGLGVRDITPAGRRFLAEAAHLSPDGVLMLQEASFQPGGDPEAPHLFGDGVPKVRFVAGFRLGGGFRAGGDANGRPGVLVVADILPHAGLDVARIAILRAHAAEFSFRMEPSGRQSTTRQLRRFEAIAANANDAAPVGRTPPGGYRLQAVRGNGHFGPVVALKPKAPSRVSFPPATRGVDRHAPDPLHPALPPWEPIEIKLLNARNDGTEFWDELNIVPVSNADGCYTHWVSVRRDAGHPAVAEAAPVRAHAAEVPPDYSASRDGLSRLHDRDSFMDRLDDVLGRSQGNRDLRCVVLLIELERFDRVDDGHAPHARDFLLTEQIRRLKTSTRARDTLARLGDGEFALLIEGLCELTFVTAVVNRIIETMGRPLRFGNWEVRFLCSIGVVHATERHAAGYRAARHHVGAEAMLQDARIALRQIQA